MCDPLAEAGGKGNAMPYMLVRHKVEDYDRWKPIFDEHGAVREESGSKGGRLFRNADDPNETIILFEWDDLDKACQFAHVSVIGRVVSRRVPAGKIRHRSRRKP